MFSFFRRQKTSDSDKNGKGDKDKKDGKNKEKYTPGLSSPGTSAKRKDEIGKEKAKESSVMEKMSRVGEDETLEGSCVVVEENECPMKIHCEESTSTSVSIMTPESSTITTRSLPEEPQGPSRNLTASIKDSDISVIAARNVSDLYLAPLLSEFDVAIAKGDVTSATGSDLIPTTTLTSTPEKIVIIKDNIFLKNSHVFSDFLSPSELPLLRNYTSTPDVTVSCSQSLDSRDNVNESSNHSQDSGVNIKDEAVSPSQSLNSDITVSSTHSQDSGVNIKDEAVSPSQSLHSDITVSSTHSQDSGVNINDVASSTDHSPDSGDDVALFSTQSSHSDITVSTTPSSDNGVHIDDELSSNHSQQDSEDDVTVSSSQSVICDMNHQSETSDVIVNGVAVGSTAGSNVTTFTALKSWISTPKTNEDDNIEPTFSLVIPVQPQREREQQEVNKQRGIEQDSDVKPKKTLLTTSKINFLSAIPNVPTEQNEKKVQIKSGWKRLEDVEKEKELREIEKKNLVSQETRFQEQLSELKAQLSVKDTERNQLLYKMEELERGVSEKSSGMDRLQAELEAAHKESQCVRQKLRLLENDVADYRHKNVELSDEILKKTEEAATEETIRSDKVAELETSLKEMEEKMKELQTELEEIRVERDMLEEERAEMEAEREEEMKIVQEALEEVQDEKTEIQTKYEKDFEKLRTVNTDREQQLLNDFEWKLREVEQACKRRLEEKDKKAEEKIRTAHSDMLSKIEEAEKQLSEVQKLKTFEAEALQLRSMNHDQQKSLRLAARQTEQLQVSELILKEEVSQLRSAIDKEKKSSTVLLVASEKRISDLDKKLHSRLDLQKTELNDQWEQRLRKECSRLKAELDHLHEEEKHLAIESLKIQKDQEAQVNKQSWEKRLQESLKEISTMKEHMMEKEIHYQREMEKAQTNTDRDILELRRKLDKLDMSYQSQIESLKENHEKDMEQLTWESGRKVQQMEQSWQLQTSSTRTTLELVKEQMERDAQTCMEDAENKHRIQLEQQWDQLTQQKEEEIQQLLENHSQQLQRVKEEFATSLKDSTVREAELVSTNECLGKQLSSNCSLIGDLQGNADRIHGSVQVLNDQVMNHAKEILRVENQALEKLREREAELEADKQSRLMELQDQYAQQSQQWQAQFNATKEQILSLSKSLEETRALNESRPSRNEDLKRIADLQRALIERDKRLATASEELRLYELELLNRDTIFTSQSLTAVPDAMQYVHGPKKKGGGKGTNPPSKPSGQPVPTSSSKSAKVSASHNSRARSADYPAIKVLTKSPTRKAKKNIASHSSTISTL